MILAEAQHFVRDPHWTWYILFYFFFAGVAGGSYTIATLLRLRGRPSDEPTARLGYYVAFVVLLLCPPMLILDLGQPLRFWHMMWNTTPGVGLPNFKYWSPMSVGVWGLLGFNAFAAISAAEALVRDGRLRLPLAQRAVGLLDGPLGRVVMIVGSVFALFIAGYTGVLLSVSNQPVWSDTWALGGLFLASGLSSAVAVLTLLSRYRRGAEASLDVLHVSERIYALLELVMIVLFALSLIGTGVMGRVFGFPFLLLWLVVLVSLAPGLRDLIRDRLSAGHHDLPAPPPSSASIPQGADDHGDVSVPSQVGTSSVATADRPPAPVTTTVQAGVGIPVLVLVGVMCLRFAVIFSVL